MAYPLLAVSSLVLSTSMEPWCRLNNVKEYFSSFQSGTPHRGHTFTNHLFLSHLPARLFKELLIINSLLQWVVSLAVSPMISIERIPWSCPVLDGHNLILSINLKILTLFLKKRFFSWPVFFSSITMNHSIFLKIRGLYLNTQWCIIHVTLKRPL